MFFEVGAELSRKEIYEILQRYPSVLTLRRYKYFGVEGWMVQTRGEEVEEMRLEIMKKILAAQSSNGNGNGGSQKKKKTPRRKSPCVRRRSR